MQELSATPSSNPPEARPAGPDRDARRPSRASFVRRAGRCFQQMARPRRLLLFAALLGVTVAAGYRVITGHRIEADLRASRDAVARSRYELAVPHLARVLKSRPDHAEALLLAARVARRM